MAIRTSCELGATYEDICDRYDVDEECVTDAERVLRDENENKSFYIHASVPDGVEPYEAEIQPDDKVYSMSMSANELFGLED